MPPNPEKPEQGEEQTPATQADPSTADAQSAALRPHWLSSALPACPAPLGHLEIRLGPQFLNQRPRRGNGGLCQEGLAATGSSPSSSRRAGTGLPCFLN